MHTRITREEVAKVLECSVNEVRRREGRGHFKPVHGRGKDNRVFYSLEQIEMYKKRRQEQRGPDLSKTDNVRVVTIAPDVPFTVEEARSVFAELRKGASPLDCIERLPIHPDKIEGILRSYERIAGAIVINSDKAAIINKMPLDGVFPVVDADGIIALLQASAKEPSCSSCGKRPRVMCKTCAFPYVKKQLEKEMRVASQQPALESAELDED